MTNACALVDVVGSLAAVAVIAMTGSARAAPDQPLRAELEEVARRRIFFGHQSVGLNLLEGLEQLARGEGVVLHILQSESAAGLGPATFGHGLMPENGDPLRKLKSFERVLGGGSTAEIALLKFCYADITETTDVPALFASYQASLAALQAKHPGITFIHVTVPLTAVQTGPKALIKRLLGRPAGGVLDNVRREEFNALVRKASAGKAPLFDLALVESTAPDGRRETFQWKGRSVPALVPSYTADGGHLLGDGQLRAARELVAVLASAPLGSTSAQR